jgi:ADP-dependent NAD(P)H-hydrate dehydratase
MPARSRRNAAGGADAARPIDERLLREWPLPAPDAEGDKSARGLVVCVGGAPELPGTVVLAGTAALRAGAGTLRIGTLRSLAVPVGLAVPEALVFGLPETRAGGIAASAAAAVVERAERARSLLIGPGLVDIAATTALLERLLPRLRQPGVVILDARALDAAAGLHEVVRRCSPTAVLTPHAGEMARLLSVEREAVEADPLGLAHQAADRFGAVVALKGAVTWVVEPSGDSYCYREGHVGLATSGSGDTLAGVIAGLAARGASPAQAAVWGVYLHGQAGNRLTQSVGQIGFLARELLAEVPRVMAGLVATPTVERG